MPVTDVFPFTLTRRLRVEATVRSMRPHRRVPVHADAVARGRQATEVDARHRRIAVHRTAAAAVSRPPDVDQTVARRGANDREVAADARDARNEHGRQEGFPVMVKSRRPRERREVEPRLTRLPAMLMLPPTL